MQSSFNQPQPSSSSPPDKENTKPKKPNPRRSTKGSGTKKNITSLRYKSIRREDAGSSSLSNPNYRQSSRSEYIELRSSDDTNSLMATNYPDDFQAPRKKTKVKLWPIILIVLISGLGIFLILFLSSTLNSTLSLTTTNQSAGNLSTIDNSSMTPIQAYAPVLESHVAEPDLGYIEIKNPLLTNPEHAERARAIDFMRNVIHTSLHLELVAFEEGGNLVSIVTRDILQKKIMINPESTFNDPNTMLLKIEKVGPLEMEESLLRDENGKLFKAASLVLISNDGSMIDPKNLDILNFEKVRFYPENNVNVISVKTIGAFDSVKKLANQTERYQGESVRVLGEIARQVHNRKKEYERVNGNLGLELDTQKTVDHAMVVGLHSVPTLPINSQLTPFFYHPPTRSVTGSTTEAVTEAGKLASNTTKAIHRYRLRAMPRHIIGDNPIMHPTPEEVSSRIRSSEKRAAEHKTESIELLPSPAKTFSNVTMLARFLQRDPQL